MSNRMFYTVLSLISLGIGAAIYILFRNDVIFMRPFADLGFIRTIKNTLSFEPLSLLSCYLPDFCWVFSLNCGLLAIFDDSRISITAGTITAFSYGVLWEILQYASVVSGTGDIVDVVLYLLGALCAATIAIKRRKPK